MGMNINFNFLNSVRSLSILCLCLSLCLSIYLIHAWHEYEDFHRVHATRADYINFTENSLIVNKYNDYSCTFISRGIRDLFSLGYVDFWDIRFRVIMRVFQIAVSVTISFILWVILYFNHSRPTG
jgi:hypothetical protein